VTNAGNQLNTLAHKLDNVEKNLLPDPTQIQEQETVEIPVLELLESVSDVTSEYEHLRRDLTEMHQLQQEMTSNLKYQVRIMNQTFQLLKQRIEAKNLQPHIQAEFSQNSRLLLRQRSQLSLPTSTTTLYSNHHK
jgi:predicted RNase H-like nuclease (RuvC/YqgF family)